MLEEKKEAIFVKTFLDKVYYFLNKYRKNLIFKRLDPKPEDIVRLECVDISYAIIDIYCEEIKYQYFDLNKDKFIGKVFKCYRLFSKPNKDLPITECLQRTLDEELIIPVVTPTYINNKFSRLYLLHAYVDLITEKLKLNQC